MTMIYPLKKSKDSNIIHILMTHVEDILNHLHHNLHKKNQVKHTFKLLNVKVVVQDVIVNALEKELWVSLVCSFSSSYYNNRS